MLNRGNQENRKDMSNNKWKVEKSVTCIGFILVVPSPNNEGVCSQTVAKFAKLIPDLQQHFLEAHLDYSNYLIIMHFPLGVH